MNHEHYMRRCLQLAELGLAEAAPNPSVGAVLVHENKIIGEGYTSPYGGAHGEVNCINNAKVKYGKIPANSILYVSLEPCSHFGKTPPCSDLIIKHKISRVVIANTDPNPLVAGKGIAKLRTVGIEVIEGVLEDQGFQVNKRFFTFHAKKRPYITLKWAQTTSGFFAPNNKEQFWITNKKTKALVHIWRSQEMGILLGANTIRIDNPRLNTRLIAGKSPIRIIIYTHEALDEQVHIFKDGLPTIVFSFKAQKNFNQVKFFQLNPDENIPKQVINTLYEFEINSILIEGGAFTLNSFIEAGLWDEARVLTGAKELPSGIEAPKIRGNLIEEFQILEDNIQILRRKI
jgi:diaminohydroxyphosphoribosylaminopyrimidine deaminase/5-amino-6-(5-phosphoribosylamino)uracil reductase